MNGHSKTDENVAEVRNVMKKYWEIYKPSLESMMLSNDAKYLAENEQNEIISYLPSYKGAKILELGAGIGRFTGKLSLVASEVTAVDFMESYVKENERSNGDFGNIKFICADVMQLDFEKESFDMVFSNWLLMYLSDTEVEKLMTHILKWLKPGGSLFFRESCYHPSGNIPRSENPTNYRTPLGYSKLMFQSATEKHRYNVISARSVLTYIHAHGNPNQLCILARKEENDKTTNGWLKSMKYNEIREFSSEDSSNLCWDICGGTDFVKNLCNSLEFQARQRVFHVGCGQGKLSCYLSQNFNLSVHGIEDSIVKIHKAIENQGTLTLDQKKMLQFEYSNLNRVDPPGKSFTYVISLDPSNNTPVLLSKAQELLHPGGHLVFSCIIPKKTYINVDYNWTSEEELKKDLRSNDFLTTQMTSTKDQAVRCINQQPKKQDRLVTMGKLLEQNDIDWVIVVATKI